MINVTKSFVPPLTEYTALLERVWSNVQFTNRGELVRELEGKLKKYLGVEHLTLTANGTLPLHIALRALDITGEVITTPFSYIASTSCIVWERCTPIFVDIDPIHLTIDENKIEEAITTKTSAILATHVFGNPAAVEKIETLAKKYNLKVIYDAAHSFGVNYKGKSIFNYGDVSTCSFHATKIFHTGEGGCWITNNEALQQKLYSHHNFGHKGKEDFQGLGLNAKMSELQAAMGLTVYNYIDEIILNRRTAVQLYNEHFKNENRIQTLTIREGTDWNFHYYPLIFENRKTLFRTVEKLNEKNIFPRRYFYPSLNLLSHVQSEKMANSERISQTILCLPLSSYISAGEVSLIANIIIENL